MPYFSDYAWFQLVWILIADLRILSQVLGEKVQIWGQTKSRELAKEAQYAQDVWSNAQIAVQGKPENDAFGRWGNDRARGHHGLAVVTITVCGGYHGCGSPKTASVL